MSLGCLHDSLTAAMNDTCEKELGLVLQWHRETLVDRRLCSWRTTGSSWIVWLGLASDSGCSLAVSDTGSCVLSYSAANQV